MRRILGLIIISLLFIVKRDGFFPFSPNSNPVLIYFGNTVLLLLFILSIYVVIRPQKIHIPNKISNFFNTNLKTLAIIILFTNVLCILLLTIYAYISFKDFYSINYPLLFIISICAVIFPALFILKKRPKTALIMLFLASFVLSVYIIYFFPITAKLSDLMPIVIKQGQALLSGQNIYQYYMLDNGVGTQAVRQPGIILLYLPAVILNFDPRIMSALYFLATGVILLKFAYPNFSKLMIDKKFYLVFIILCLFLLLPYKFLRADLYEPPFWFVLFTSLYLLYKNRLKSFAILWGIGIFTQVWCWIATPFVMVYLLRKYGLKKTLSTSAMYLSIGIGVLLLFILPNPQSYLEHVFGFYKNSQDMGAFPKVSMFLTPWVYLLGLQKYLQVIQISICMLVGLFALKFLKTFRDLLVYISIVILVFIQFLIISWTYMYLNILFLLMIYVVLSVERKHITK